MSVKQKVIPTLLAIIASAAFCLPSQAQYSITGEQPVVGSLHQQELHLKEQLNNSYAQGLIDPFELANRTRDLDAIRVHEDALRIRKQRMTANAMQKIVAQLNAFQSDLDYRCGLNATRSVASR
jgi:hypothetical protein